MVKIEEADDAEHQQRQQPEEEEEVEHIPQHFSANSSSPPLSPIPSSSFNQPYSLYQSPPSAAQTLSSPAPESPCSSTSISSDHTFHGFSPQPESVTLPSLSPSPPVAFQPSHPRHPAVVNRLIRDEQPPSVTKTESNAVTGFANEGEATAGGGGGKRAREREWERKGRGSISTFDREKRHKVAVSLAFSLRVFELLLCLISFSVMVSDKNRGWALDSFDRYKEFRYSTSVNVIGFVYSVLQTFSVACLFARNNRTTRSPLRCYFDFVMDQMLAYLLVSASSSAATRIDDWVLNWGKDKFPAMASASVGMSFVAFVAFALSSLISGYLLCSVHRSS